MIWWLLVSPDIFYHNLKLFSVSSSAFSSLWGSYKSIIFLFPLPSFPWRQTGLQFDNKFLSLSWANKRDEKDEEKKKQFFLLCEEDDRLLSNFSKKKDFDGCSDRRRFLQEIGLHLHSFHPSAFPSLLLPLQPFFLENYFSFSFVTIEKMCKGAFQCSVAYKS